MIKKLLKILLIAVVVILAIAYTRPDDYKVERTLKINAAADKIFAQVNTLKKWDAWSPWTKIDPDAKMTFEGPDSGVGSSMAWDGNMEVGTGKMTITESSPSKNIKFILEFKKPFEGISASEFNLTPDGSGTNVSWSMAGKNNLIGKVIGLFIDCEKMIGEKYDEGLANLKKITE